MYGKGINVSEIIELNDENYSEKLCYSIDSSFNKDLIGMHQMHQIDDYFVIDGRYK